MRIVARTLLVVAVFAPLTAQTTSGSIAGDVRDAHDAAITNATVTITKQEMGIALTTKTGAEG